MAEATTPEQTAPQAPAPTPTERGVEALHAQRAEAEASATARASEVSSLAGERPAAAAPGSAPSAAPKDEDVKAIWDGLSEGARTAIAKSFESTYNQMLEREYGPKLLALIPKIRENPNLRATLEAAGEDPELLTVLADPSARSILKDLSKKELREFLFGDAKTTYEKYAVGEAAPAQDPREARLEALEERERERESRDYIGGRQREILALRSEFSNLDKRTLHHIVDHAEQRFLASALQRGIRTTNADGSPRISWAAEALRAGVRPPSYREAYEYYAEVLGRTPPPAAPATSPPSAPGAPQAPRDASEGKQRALQLLKNSGGLRGLQAMKGK